MAPVILSRNITEVAMVHHTYNPISIIAALLANSRHRLHSVLSHPHIRCNPQQPVPAGAPGWGSRMENSLLHWHSWETENSDFGKSEPCTSAEATPVSPLCLKGPRKEWMQHVLLLHSLPLLQLLSVCLQCSHSRQALCAQLQKCSTWREWCLLLKQHLK